MKILSIKGKNLASLEGEFVIDFENGAIGRAGLFAITGPTGAGKSTILDALCVALFDKTPRLSRSGGALIGRAGEDDAGKLNSSDVRSLLRRGTGSGYAEVVFMGHDGSRYQSRWTVRRARDAANGRFQQQNIVLRNLDTGQVLGGTKTETLDRVEELVGLTYEQFCRSVLLAQGEFAAFLRAGEKERSELLERITGTEIYGMLSTAAYRRAREEEQNLKQLEDRKGEIVVLDEEERKTVEVDLERVGVSLKEVQGQLAVAEKASEWYQRRLALRDDVSSAELMRSEAETAWEGAEGLRVELAGVESVLPLRSMVENADSSRARADRAAHAAEEQKMIAAAAEERFSAARAALEKAQSDAGDAEKNSENAKPLLAKARDLDTRISGAESDAKEADTQADAAVAAAAESLKALSELDSEKGVIEGQIEDANSWLDRNKVTAPLAAEWNRWQEELKRFIKNRHEGGVLEKERATLVKDEQKKAEDLDSVREKLKVAEEVEADARKAREESEKSAASIPMNALSKERMELEKRRDTFRTLAQLATEAAGAVKEKTEAGVAADAARTEVAAARAAWQVASHGIERVGVTLAEADRAFHLANTALSLEGRRADLREGEPCPLCGSLEHPWAAGGSPESALLKDLEKRVNDLRTEKTGLEKAEATTREKETGLLAAIAGYEKQQDECEKTIAARQTDWEKLRKLVADTALPGNACDEGAIAMTSVAKEGVEKRLGEIHDLEETGHALYETAEKCRRTHDKAVAEKESATARLASADKAHREISEKLRLVSRDLQQVEASRKDAIDSLSAAFAGRDGWQELLLSNPEKFCAGCAGEVEEWRTWTGRCEDGRKSLSELMPRIEAARSRMGELQKFEREKRADQEKRAGILNHLREERLQCFSGRSVSEVEAEFAAILKEARDSLEKKKEDAGQTDKQLAAVKAALEKMLDDLRLLGEAAALASATLQKAIADAGLSEEVVRERLSRDNAWINGKRGELALLEKQLHEARIIFKERHQMLAKHEKSGEPAIAEGLVSAAQEAAKAEKENLDQQQFELRHRIETDAGAHKRIAELLPEIASQRARTELWQRVSEIIGSADGKKFRTYAQSLTLEVLLGYANEHLQSLAPRYAVVRAPSSEMELQMVDRDMGDEVRSVNSLSGGESFLVSLALALGLSSLSSHTTQVESLFIDEGFGSLDPDTLEVALATLDSLQASGRRVGIISHVPGLAERIGVRIEVMPVGGGRSSVRVVGV